MLKEFTGSRTCSWNDRITLKICHPNAEKQSNKNTFCLRYIKLFTISFFNIKTNNFLHSFVKGCVIKKHTNTYFYLSNSLTYFKRAKDEQKIVFYLHIYQPCNILANDLSKELPPVNKSHYFLLQG